jgi:hypothetical protein
VPDIRTPSISETWKQAVTLANASTGHEACALVATVTGLSGGGPQEDAGIRARLDQSLLANGNSCVETVAGTIFPQSLWNPAAPRELLFARYGRIFPRIRRHPKNRRGTYFQRMIAYPTPAQDSFNQLDQVINTYRSGNHRRSALQAGIIVPQLDLNNARQLGFPCMHQVAFLPDRDQRYLQVVGFYPLQYLYERAYGNYLGLVRLGRFMAHEMGLELESMSCISVIAKMEAPQNILAAVLP